MTQPPTTTAPSRQKLQAKRASKPRRITGLLKTALDFMVWGDKDGLAMSWDKAATHAKYTVRSMRLALEKPHVRAYLNEQRHVFAAQAGASNISHAVHLREKSPNQMTKMAAVRFIEEVATGVQAIGPQRARQPGLVIVINQNQPPAPELVDDGQIITIGRPVDAVSRVGFQPDDE